MKKLLTMLASIALASLMSFTGPQKPASYNVDIKSSQVVWKAYKVTGSHTGNIQLKSGNLEFTNGALTGGKFEIDMNSIACTDLSGEYAGKLVGHLKSDDFFGVATYPTSKFVITKVVSRGTPGAYKIQGDLTIKGITQSIKFNADLKEDGSKTVAEAKITVDRSDYNIRYGSGSFFENLGDKTIYDDFDLEIKLVTNK